jgi:hypothetical protein
VWIVQLALRRPYTFVVLAMLIVLVGLVEIPRMLRAANQPGADRRYQGRPAAGVKGAGSEYAVGRLTDSRDRASGAGDTSARLRHKTAL